MSKNVDSLKLEKSLSYSDKELLSNFSRLGSLIKNFENISWDEARNSARQLLNDGDALSYIQEVRASIEKPKSKSRNATKKKKSTKKKKVVPLNTSKDRYSMNYKRLLKIAPNLDELLETGEDIYGKSQSSGYMDLNLELIHTDKTGYYIALSHYFKQNGDMVPDPDMQILVDVKNQRVEALALQNQLYYREVYDDIHKRKLVRLAEKKSQNAFLEKWLIELKNQGHQVEWIEEDNEEAEQVKEKEITKEPIEEFPSKPDISYMDEKIISEVKEFAQKGILDEIAQLYTEYADGKKKIRPVALFFIIDRLNTSPLGISIEYPSEKELKEDYKSLVKQKEKNKKIDEVAEELVKGENQKKEKKKPSSKYIARFNALGVNHILKLNFQKFMRLVPDLFELNLYDLHTIVSSKTNEELMITNNGQRGELVNQFEIVTKESVPTKWVVAVQKNRKKLLVESYTWKKDKSKEELNKEFSIWLDKKVKQHFKSNLSSIKEVSQKFPIVILWAEGSDDYNIGINSLEELQDKLNDYEVKPKDRGYTKVKVKFRNYPNYIRIDLSQNKGDYDPKKQELIDWLEDYDRNFDWLQFSKKSLKEKLKKDALTIPDFEVGKVKLVEAHKRAGITQKHIDWINKHKQGMVVTPIKRMVNNTEDFFSDAVKKAKRPGFRISRTGKLYYETRSNRSDITGAGL